MSQNKLTIVIEDIYHPHNAISIIKSSIAFGIKEIYVIEKEYKFDLAKINFNLSEYVKIYYFKDSLECIKELKSKGYKIVSTTPHNETIELEDFKLEEKTALVFGTEETGISKEIIDNSDLFLKIKTYGFTESLNISVCVGIILNFFSKTI